MSIIVSLSRNYKANLAIALPFYVIALAAKPEANFINSSD